MRVPKELAEYFFFSPKKNEIGCLGGVRGT